MKDKIEQDVHTVAVCGGYELPNFVFASDLRVNQLEIGNAVRQCPSLPGQVQAPAAFHLVRYSDRGPDRQQVQRVDAHAPEGRQGSCQSRTSLPPGDRRLIKCGAHHPGGNLLWRLKSPQMQALLIVLERFGPR